MQLLVVRHAAAEDKDAFAASGRDDALRPLTADGVRKMRRGAHGLKELIPTIDLLVTSPLTRARETAEIVRREYEIDRVETADVLEPGLEPRDVAAWLAQYRDGVVGVVGHEPQLGRLVTYLVSGIDRPGVELKKGGACLLEFESEPHAAGGTLVWAIPPGAFRDLAG